MDLCHRTTSHHLRQLWHSLLRHICGTNKLTHKRCFEVGYSSLAMHTSRQGLQDIFVVHGILCSLGVKKENSEMWKTVIKQASFCENKTTCIILMITNGKGCQHDVLHRVLMSTNRLYHDVYLWTTFCTITTCPLLKYIYLLRGCPIQDQQDSPGSELGGLCPEGRVETQPNQFHSVVSLQWFNTQSQCNIPDPTGNPLFSHLIALILSNYRIIASCSNCLDQD